MSKELSEELKAYFSPIVTDEVTVEKLNETILHGIAIHRCLMDEAGIENSMSFSSGDMIVIYQRKEGKKHFDLWVEAKEKIKELESKIEKAEAKNKKFERYISFMVVSCPECGYERSSYSTPPSFNCSQCGCELEGES